MVPTQGTELGLSLLLLDDQEKRRVLCRKGNLLSEEIYEGWQAGQLGWKYERRGF